MQCKKYLKWRIVIFDRSCDLKKLALGSAEICGIKMGLQAKKGLWTTALDTVKTVKTLYADEKIKIKNTDKHGGN